MLNTRFAASVALKDESLVKNTCFINGEWVGADNGGIIQVTNPATGEVLGIVPKMGADETRRAIEACEKALPGWRAKTGKERAAILRRWYELMLENQDDLAVIMTAEQGKPLAESRGEIGYAASFLEWFAEEGKRVYGDTIPGHARDKRIIILKQPIGVCAAITPWNFPAAMLTRKIGPALAAGCTMVLKPASQTPFSALALCVLAERAGMPSGVIACVTGAASAIGGELSSNTGGLEPWTEFARVNVKPDGSVIVYTGVSPHGQGHATTFAMVASEELGVPFERITVLHGDTDQVARGGGTLGSRSLQLGGGAVYQGSIETVAKARETAADLFEAAAGDVVLDKGRGGFHVAGSPDEFRTWAEVAAGADAEHGLIVDTDFNATGASFPFGAHLAVVEVDADTAQPRLVRIVTVDDAGPVLNPVIVEGQRHGGIAQGAAQALFEEVLFDADGNPQSTNFADYAFPSAAELPDYELVVMETRSPHNPLGVKGIGEAGTIGATPAVQNAVIDAVAHLGVRHIDMPTTPERVWRAINVALARRHKGQQR